jgi:hypothetical protein
MQGGVSMTAANHRQFSRMRRRSWRLPIVVGLVPFVLLSLSGYGRSEESRGLAGSWSGGGWVSFSSGSKERARCRAHYTAHSESSYSLNATCATEAGKASQSATLRKVGANSYVGHFHNSEYGVSGSIHVVINGNSQSVTLTSDSGSASLTLTR